MEQPIFSPSVREEIETYVLAALNKQATSVVSPLSMHSPRAVGDGVQDFLAQHLQACFPKGVITTFETGFERRSMEDMAFYDAENCYHAVDVKTQNVDTAFNMPNLISVRRLAKFYSNHTNFFNLLMVQYKQKGDKLCYTSCLFLPIENLKWDCLTLGALGWGQIQIANANNIQIDRTQTRREWMLKLCDRLDFFYDEEIGKIAERKSWFADIRDSWEQQPK